MLKDNVRQSLETLLPQRQITMHPVELITYEVDGGLGRGEPDAVVFPETVQDVVRLVRWAAAEAVPLVARSAGTGLSGGAVPVHGGIVVSFARMNQVLELNEAERLAVIQPGLINLNLDTLVKKRGLYFPPDPASQRASSVGGNIAENAGGPHCFKYGVTTNYIQDLEAVLANGEVVHTAGKAYDYPAYDFTGLLTGSEGTLALITASTLRLIRNAPGVKTLTATFDSIETAGQAVSAIIGEGLVPAALEMMDRNIIGIIEDYVHAGLPTQAAALLLLEVDGYPESLDAQMDEIVQVLKRSHALELHVCTAKERDQIWFARKSAFGAMARLSPSYFQVDGTVPRTKLADTLAVIGKLCASRDLRVAFVFHAGDGNLHPLIPFDPADEAMTKKVYEVGHEFLKRCVEQNGTISGEHGIGTDKSRFMPWMYTADELNAMREVKQVFDPKGLFNPGKIFPDSLPVDQPAPVASGSISISVSSPFAPQSEEEAADGLRAARASKRRVVVRGGGTQSAPPTSDAVLLSTANLKGVVEYGPRDLYVTVKAGTSLADLQATLAADKLWVPLAAPWQKSTLGGIVSTGLNSPQRLRYGALRDQVLGLRAILPDGRRVRFGRPVVKNVAGYDMVKLFAGAYGTLGLITEVTLRLTALPRARRTLLLPVSNFAEGVKWAGRVLPLTLVASSVLVVKNPGLNGKGPYALAYTAEGYAQDVEAELRAVRSAWNGAAEPVESETRHGIDHWADLLRRHSSHIRVGVPHQALPALVQGHEAALGSTYVADLANGLIYAPPEARLDMLRPVALAAGGYAVVTATRREGNLDPWGYVPDVLLLMQQLKECWDPTGYFNPGVFVV